MKKKTILIFSVMLLSIMMFGCSNKSNQSLAETPTETTTPVETTAEIETDSTDASINEYMKTNNVTLKAKDVQFDMNNNLNKKFAIEGLATIDDYYNYGYTDETNYFCIKVNTDDTPSNSWYLYCSRTSFTEVFDLLKEGNNVYITATCYISSNVFKPNQGNMAEVSSMEWITN
ncbi:hypothetical protein KTC92_02500 [Clostridium sp. CM027]|uniref:hypothetical protein n=1 Tax=Clostridium sp. CM027 TaxID=2849865 RepID=UPI001C6F3B36|nr:hypothetical protein [Clostridium sp. CM027]MBW9147295.1 hypothetical protein [Clostridium sp. CM027]UVE41387.1 hypothetical protein KTC92_02500 [Clostridium sp. CM027]